MPRETNAADSAAASEERSGQGEAQASPRTLPANFEGRAWSTQNNDKETVQRKKYNITVFLVKNSERMW